MLGSCRLNNKSMRNVRRTETYQAMAIDLALLGVITKEECEMLLDGGIPSGIVLPDSSSKITSEKALPPKPEFIKTEPVDTETGDTETGDTETGDTETGDTETGDTETDRSHGPVSGYEIIDTETGDTEPSETQETVNDEGRTESDN